MEKHTCTYVVLAQETAKQCTVELLVNACATAPAGKTPGKVPSKARAGHTGRRALALHVLRTKAPSPMLTIARPLFCLLTRVTVTCCAACCKQSLLVQKPCTAAVATSMLLPAAKSRPLKTHAADPLTLTLTLIYILVVGPFGLATGSGGMTQSNVRTTSRDHQINNVHAPLPKSWSTQTRLEPYPSSSAQ